MTFFIVLIYNKKKNLVLFLILLGILYANQTFIKSIKDFYQLKNKSVKTNQTKIKKKFLKKTQLINSDFNVLNLLSFILSTIFIDYLALYYLLYILVFFHQANLCCPIISIFWKCLFWLINSFFFFGQRKKMSNVIALLLFTIIIFEDIIIHRQLL